MSDPWKGMSDPLKGIGALAICIIIGWLTIGAATLLLLAVRALFMAALP